MVLDERGELEKINRTLKSLVHLGCYKLNRVGRELDAFSTEFNKLIKKVEDQRKCNKLLKEDAQRCKDKKNVVKRVLTRVQEELARWVSECKCLLNARTETERHLKKKAAKLQPTLKGLLKLQRERDRMDQEQASASR